MAFIQNLFNRLVAGVTGRNNVSQRDVAFSGSASGPVYTVTRLLGGSSTLALITGTNSNLTIDSSTGVITAASTISAGSSGASQLAVVREVAGSLAVEYPVSINVNVPTLPVKLVALGDSITAHAESYANAFRNANSSIASATLAASGRGIGTSANANDGGNTLWGQLQNAIDAAGSVYTILIGANDLLNGADADVYKTNLSGFIAALKSGRPGCVVGVGTVLPRGDLSAANNTEFNTRRNYINPLIRGLSAFANDFAIPFGGHPLFYDTAPDDGIVFDSGDKLHPSTVGRTTMAGVYTAVMSSIFANATGTSPQNFSFTAVNNATPSTVYTGQSAPISGLGMGVSSAATVSGAGIFAQGSGSFDTAAKQVINGDVIRVRETTSANGNITTTTTVSVGNVNAVYSVTTATATALAWASSPNYQSSFTSGTTTPWTITGLPMTEGRQVLYINKIGADPSSVTIDGVAATKVGQTNGGGSAVSVWLSAQILTAGNYNVVVTMGYYNNAGMVYGALSGPAIASTSFAALPIATKNPGSWPATAGTPAQTVASGGIMLIFEANPTGAQTMSFANTTVDRSFSNVSGSAANSATGTDVRSFKSTTSMTPTLVLDAFSNAISFVAVTFNP